MQQFRTALAAAVLLCAALHPAHADNVGDLKEGEAIAQKQCVSCHAVKGTSSADAAAAPSLEAIANVESATILSIRVWLRTAHRNKTMPNIMLEESEVDSLASYILSLRSKK